jgi:hypothetical protein
VLDKLSPLCHKIVRSTMLSYTGDQSLRWMPKDAAAMDCGRQDGWEASRMPQTRGASEPLFGRTIRRHG